MSSFQAIAAVTATIRTILELEQLPVGTDVTTHPPEKAKPETESQSRLNVFCYRTSINGAWRNQDLPGRVRSGETGRPALPLNLHYAITAFGADKDEVAGNAVLGIAMRALHDRPVLERADIAAVLEESELHRQLERVRITLEPLSLDDISKLWMTFQCEYRLSAFYEASLVLIESTVPARTPLPVLTRGPKDAGPVALGSTTLPYPTITSITPAVAPRRPAVETGDVLTVVGHHLGADSLEAHITGARMPEPVVQPVEPNPTEVAVGVAVPASVPAGNHTLVLVLTTGSVTRRTNEAPFAVAPTITSGLPSAPVPAGDLDLSLSATPAVGVDEPCTLLFGGREAVPAPRQSTGDPLVFELPGVEPGRYPVRLRVSGVDSLLIDYGADPLVFRADQTVAVQ